MPETVPRRAARRVGHHRSRLPSTTTLERWVMIGFIALLALMPLMLGTTAQRPWPMVISRFGILFLFFGYLLARLRTQVPTMTTGLWIVMFGATLFGLLQVTPLPPGLIALLSPQADALFHQSLDSMGLYGSGQWRALSLDPAETWQALSGFAGLLMVYLIAANLVSHQKNMECTLQAIGIIGFAVAMVGFIQKAVGTERILGLIAFEQEIPFFFSTFINPNHLAGFLGMSVPIQISFALKTRQRQQKLAYLLMALVTSTAIFLSLSRGGIIAFLIGQILLAFMVWRRHRVSGDVIWIQVVVAAVIGLAALLALNEIAHEFDAGSTVEEALSINAKPLLWEDTLDIVSRYPLTGIGSEAFKVAYPIYKTTPHDKLFTYPENIVLQIFAESGVLVGSLLLISVVIGLWLIFRRRHLKRYEIGAFCALAVVAIHNYVDFNLSSYAVSVPFVTLLAILTSRISEQARSPWIFRRNMPQPVLLGFTAFGATAIIAGQVLWMQHRLPLDQQRLHAAVYDAARTDAAFNATFGRVLSWHPADYYLRLLVSERYLPGSYADLPHKILNLNKAKRLNPTSPLVEMMIGKAWAGVGNMEQARAAFEQACRMIQPAVSMDDHWTQMLKAGMTFDDLMMICQRNEKRILELSHFMINHGAHDDAKKLLLDWLGDHESSAPETLYLLGVIALDDKKFADAETVGRRLIRDFPKQHGGYLLLGRLNIAQGAYRQALSWFKKAESVSPYNLEIWFPMARVLVSLGKLEEAEDLANRIHGISWNHPSKKINAYLLSGDIDMACERYYQAQKEYERALLYAPKHKGIHYKLAVAADKRGDTKTALKHYLQARRYGLESAAMDSAIMRLETPKPAPLRKVVP
jgi:tetratricopeptide (TPR) repeat protein/O-antigen ligase